MVKLNPVGNRQNVVWINNRRIPGRFGNMSAAGKGNETGEG
jgi:hypothetical protein